MSDKSASMCGWIALKLCNDLSMGDCVSAYFPVDVYNGERYDVYVINTDKCGDNELQLLQTQKEELRPV